MSLIKLPLEIDQSYSTPSGSLFLYAAANTGNFIAVDTFGNKHYMMRLPSNVANTLLTGFNPDGSFNTQVLGNGVWDLVCVDGGSVASATTTDLSTLAGNSCTITGTTTITAITLGDGKIRFCRFSGALTLTNGASLVLPGGNNITTVAGDWYVFVSGPSNVVYCTSYQPINSVGVMTKQKTGGGFGYLTGAGSTASQSTDKTTGVTLNANCGQVTMNAAALASLAIVGFTLTNSSIGATDFVRVNIASGGTVNSYRAFVDAVAAGSCHISLQNISLGSLSEAVVIGFTVIKAVTA